MKGHQPDRYSQILPSFTNELVLTKNGIQYSHRGCTPFNFEYFLSWHFLKLKSVKMQAKPKLMKTQLYIIQRVDVGRTVLIRNYRFLCVQLHSETIKKQCYRIKCIALLYVWKIHWLKSLERLKSKSLWMNCWSVSVISLQA